MRRASLLGLTCRWDIVRGSLQVSAVVGVLLNVINQGKAIMEGRSIAWGHVVMNFAVPFLVASYSAARNELRNHRRAASAAPHGAEDAA